MDKLHKHPMNPRVKIRGRKMKVGETIRQGDVYNSSSGRWEVTSIPGRRIQRGCIVYWVRPTSKT